MDGNPTFCPRGGSQAGYPRRRWCYFFTSRRGVELLWPQSLARVGNRSLAARSQDFANEEKIG
jgi:hypothetical protein